MEVIKINSENAAWCALNGLVSGELRPDDVTLDLSDLNWTKVKLAFRGESFNRTVTASLMSGMINFQDDLYRAAARILKNDGRITRLTNKEKSELELIFSVNNGSSELEAQGAKQLRVFEKIMEKLSGKQILIAILVFLILFFGTEGVKLYLSHVEAMQKIEAELKGQEIKLQERKDLYDLLKRTNGDKEKTILFKKAASLSSASKDITDYSNHAVDEILRHSGDASEVEYQGVTFDSSVISDITSRRRSKSENVTIKDKFLVTAVETDDTSTYRVHLASLSNDLVFIADLEDPLVSSRYQKAIQNAEWTHKPVMVHVVGRRVGQNIRDAKITKAFTPRKSKGT